MSPSTTRSGSTAPHALWLGGLLVVLAGLFGMHGLDSHGAAGADTIAHAVMIGPGADPVASGQDHMASGRAAAVHGAGSSGVTMAAGEVATSHGAMGSGMAGTCMAVLVVALIALLRMLLYARGRPLYRPLGRSARAPSYHARDPDPPSPISLSIQRC